MKTLIGAVVIGAVIITVSMIVNMMNGSKGHRQNFVRCQRSYGVCILLGGNYRCYIPGFGNSTLKAWYIGVFVVCLWFGVQKTAGKPCKAKKRLDAKRKGAVLLENAFEMLELFYHI